MRTDAIQIQRESARRDWLLGAALVLAVVFAYQPAWNAGFIWDDDDYVTNNPLITAPDGLKRIWFSTDSPSQYFPLTYTIFRAEHALWGFNAAGYHWVNILLHAANALLVWGLLRRLAIPGAWLAAGIFALHPVQVESVAWITELKNVQSLFFSLLALHAWVRSVGSERRPGRSYALALIAYVLALSSKTSACTLPAALLLVLWLQRKPIDGRRLLQIAPFVVLGLAMGLLTIWWERHHQGTRGSDFDLGFMERALIAGRAIWFYVGKLVWPADLTFSYPRWTIDAADPSAYGWLLAAGLAVAAIWFGRRRFGRAPETAALFYVATLSPMLGFIMLYTFRYSFVADHYQYFALLGPVVLAAAGISMALRHHAGWRWTLSGTVLAALAIATWRQSRMYGDVETLWRTTIARNPASFLAHNNLSAALVGAQRPDEAVTHARKALALAPAGHDLALAQVNLGNAFLQKGDGDGALGCFRRAVAVEPHYADGHNNLANALLRSGRGQEAIEHFRKAIALQPHHANAHYNLANALAERSRFDEAVEHFRRALTIRADDADAHHDLGVVLLRLDRVDEAEAELRMAAKLRPSLAAAHSNVAFILQQTGRAREAEARYATALALQPDNARTRAGFARLLATSADPAVRDEARAKTEARRALELAETGGDHPLAAALVELLHGERAGEPTIAQLP